MPRLRGACSVTHMQTQKHLEPLLQPWAALRDTPVTQTLTCSENSESLSFLPVCLASLPAFLGLLTVWVTQRVVPSQTWSGGRDPLPQSCAQGGACGLESLAWLHDCPQHRGVAWVADQLLVLRAACRHWPGGRHCGTPGASWNPHFQLVD